MSRTTLYNRHEALERAIALFWQKGFHATSLKDIEHALDMRPGSIYAAFGNKDGLFQEALDYYAQSSLTELERILANHQSPLLGLAAFMRQLGGIRDKDLPSRACMLVKSLLELGAREQVALEKVEKLLASMEARFTECFVEAQRIGEFDSDLDANRLGRRVQAEVMGLRAFAQRDVDSIAVHALAEDMATSIENLRHDALAN
ncbi:TetR/AcrR family transcriptional regulator [Psychrobacter sp. 2Y5]|uniref:TetR/AcrR family transcriptional regulator n=1 Tax=unclassified Psychrobacter TaxID=196806 RepID=UPI003F477F6C